MTYTCRSTSYTPINRAVSNQTCFLCLSYLALFSLSCTSSLQGLITQQTINTWSEKGARLRLPLAAFSPGTQAPVSYSHVTVKLGHFFGENKLHSVTFRPFLTTTSLSVVFFEFTSHVV